MGSEIQRENGKIIRWCQACIGLLYRSRVPVRRILFGVTANKNLRASPEAAFKSMMSRHEEKLA